mmetsp:Transcript_7505/g.11363  ORF Transcript_7505/g.11363 Transcript_7505/m.11363 type:complete len:528 (-) Transcript_7505:231-1814(-)
MAESMRAQSQVNHEETKHEDKNNSMSTGLKTEKMSYWKTAFSFILKHWVALVANGFEWFEFATFGYFVDEISENFANGNHTTTWFIFSIAFLVRPIGGFMLGKLGDRIGRQPAFLISSVAVVVSTVLQGALPSSRTGGDPNQQIGLAFLVILRVTQGLGIGGEVGSVITYLAECSPKGCKGIVMGFLAVSSGAGFLLSSFLAAVIKMSMPTDELLDWGWRIPFLFTIIPGYFVLKAMRHLHESPQFNRQPGLSASIENVVASNGQAAIIPRTSYIRLFVLFSTVAAAAAFWYVGCMFIFDWIDDKSVAWVAVLQNLVSIPTSIFVGYLTDRHEFNSLYLSTLVFTTLVGMLFFLSKEFTDSMPAVIIGPGILFGMGGGALGVTTTLLSAALFPPEQRTQSVGLGFNLSVCMFGGLGPTWVTLLIDTKVIPAPGVLFLLVSSLLSIIVFVLLGRHLLIPSMMPFSEKGENEKTEDDRGSTVVVGSFAPKVKELNFEDIEMDRMKTQPSRVNINIEIPPPQPSRMSVVV